MKHLIVINAESAFGVIHAPGAVLFLSISGSKHRHPVLECIDVDLSNPHYIFAKSRLRDTQEYQSLFVPHYSVVVIYQRAETDPIPMGFLTN